MVNNIEIIRNKLKFDKFGEFYYISIIQRSKDGILVKGAHDNARRIRTFYVFSLEEFDRVVPFIKEEPVYENEGINETEELEREILEGIPDESNIEVDTDYIARRNDLTVYNKVSDRPIILVECGFGAKEESPDYYYIRQKETKEKIVEAITIGVNDYYGLVLDKED